jgi:osmotically inducible protein OsmC
VAADRRAEAVWEGDLFSGHGSVSFKSSGLAETLPVSWAARTEELIAAAHAACFSMAFSNLLAQNDTPPERLEVAATATFDKVASGFAITRIHLDVLGSIPGIDADTFERIAAAAKDGCPVSGALKNNVQIDLTANLK